jgi:hypothetical protein
MTLQNQIRNKKVVVTISSILILLTILFLFVYHYSGCLITGNSTVELPYGNVIFRHELQDFGIKLQDNSILLTKELIQKYYPKILRSDGSDDEGLFFCTKYDFFEDTLFERQQLGQFEIVERHNKNDVKIAINNNDNFCINYQVKKKVIFYIQFEPYKEKSLSISRIVSDSEIEHIDRKLSSSRPQLSCDIEISVGTYEISQAGQFTERRSFTTVVSCRNLKIRTIKVNN